MTRRADEAEACTPSTATAAAGGKLHGQMVEDRATLVRRGIAETPPLLHVDDARAHARTPR